MSTLGELIAWTRDALTASGTTKEAVTALSAPLTVDALTFSVDDVDTGLVRGTAEIDFELIRTKSVDPAENAVILYPFGRGYNGTVAATHALGAEVRINPAFPASRVAREINGVLGDIYPSVYAVKTYETTFPTAGGALTMPATATGVLSVYVEDVTHPGQWFQEHRWSFLPDSSSTGYSLRVGGHYAPGHKVRVCYEAQPAPFDLTGSTTQDFTTVTGLPERCEDLIQLGVALRLARFVDVAKLPFLSAAARDMGEAKAPGVGATTTRLLAALFQQRVQQESLVLAQEHPIRIHKTGA